MKSEKLKVKGQKDQALARALADYQNLVKRTEKERLEIYVRAGKNIVEELLPVLDLLYKSQEHLKDPGLEMALEQFGQVLSKFGVEKIKVETGQPFDHALHEAVDTVEGGEPGQIASVAQEGYKWKDGMVLRPAKVVVSKGIGSDFEKEGEQRV